MPRSAGGSAGAARLPRSRIEPSSSSSSCTRSSRRARASRVSRVGDGSHPAGSPCCGEGLRQESNTADRGKQCLQVAHLHRRPSSVRIACTRPHSGHCTNAVIFFSHPFRMSWTSLPISSAASMPDRWISSRAATLISVIAARVSFSSRRRSLVRPVQFPDGLSGLHRRCDEVIDFALLAVQLVAHNASCTAGFGFTPRHIRFRSSGTMRTRPVPRPTGSSRRTTGT
jgi:hypothetical protein